MQINIMTSEKSLKCQSWDFTELHSSLLHNTQLLKYFLRKGDLKMSEQRDFPETHAWRIIERLKD